MKMKKTFFALVFMVMVASSSVFAQCAMCRSTLENNFSNGTPGIGAGINFGILYLLVLPYLGVLTLGYFWFKSTRNGQHDIDSSTPSR
jgi:hypothetical protein